MAPDVLTQAQQLPLSGEEARRVDAAGPIEQGLALPQHVGKTRQDAGIDPDAVAGHVETGLLADSLNRGGAADTAG